MGCMQVYDMMTNPDVNVQLTGIDADYIGYDGTLKKSVRVFLIIIGDHQIRVLEEQLEK